MSKKAFALAVSVALASMMVATVFFSGCMEKEEGVFPPEGWIYSEQLTNEYINKTYGDRQPIGAELRIYTDGSHPFGGTKIRRYFKPVIPNGKWQLAEKGYYLDGEFHWNEVQGTLTVKANPPILENPRPGMVWAIENDGSTYYLWNQTARPGAPTGDFVWDITDYGDFSQGNEVTVQPGTIEQKIDTTGEPFTVVYTVDVSPVEPQPIP